MVKVGVHVSIAKSLDTAIDTALVEKCDDFQIFTRNPRGWQFKPLDPDEVSVFREKLGKSGLAPAVDHMPYLPNLSCPEDVIYNKSLSTLEAEVERCVQLGIPFLVTHLGSHLGRGREVGLKRISNALNKALKHAKGDFQICLENMAGTKNSMGSKFEEVREILDSVRQKHHVAVCLDTCLAPGSLILSNEVPVPIEDVELHTPVLGLNGSTNRVVRLWRRSYSGRLISLKPEGLPSMSVTPEHPILCLRPKGWRSLDHKPWRVRLVTEPTWVYARDVRLGDFVVMPKPASDQSVALDFRPYAGAATGRPPFPSVISFTEDLAELLGLYLAEGFTFMGKGMRGDDHGKVYFAFGRHEKTLIERVRSLVDRIFSLGTWVEDSGTAERVCIGSNLLTRFFRDNFGPSAKTKRIPPFIFSARPKQVKAFLLGYLAGDGSVDSRGLRYITASKTLGYQLIRLLAKVDVHATLSRHHPTTSLIQDRRVSGTGWYTVHVSSNESKRLGFAYEFSSEAPRRILRDPSRFCLPVKEITVEAYKGQVYNLTTDSGTFTAPFIATHNCHAYAAGYDLHVEKAVEKTLGLFDETLGFENLSVVHLNDSEGGLGSGLDRHEHIGMGYIGISGFKAILHHKGIRDLPMILETPIDDRRGNAENLETVRKLWK
jgi:deoxyribonuclease-4